MKSYHLFLYFKQGDDLATVREKSSSWREAFLKHSKHLKDSAEVVAALSEIITDDKFVDITADTHMVFIDSRERKTVNRLDELAAKFPSFLSRNDDT